MASKPEIPDELKPDEEDKVPTELENIVVKTLEKLLQPIRNDIKNLIQSQKTLTEELTEERQLREQNRILSDRITKIESENVKLKNRISKIEDKLLENNLVFHGIQENPWETEAIRQDKVYLAIAETIVGRSLDDRLETARSMLIKSTRRIGTYSAMRTRSMSVEFMYKGDADYVLTNKKYLGEYIFADREYCEETESCRRTLRPYLRAARRLPQYYKKCRLDGKNLVLKGVYYSVEDIYKLPEELKNFNISSRKSDDGTILGFFGDKNVFSNFYPSSFNYNGNEFHSSEHLIQYAKAQYFNDEPTALKILNSQNARECKQLSKEIKNYDSDSWNNSAKELCEGGLLAKFEQNDEARKLLLKTGTTMIVECCKDKVWGNGIPLYDNRCMSKKDWSGQGLLGELLEEIRTKLKNNTEANPEPTAKMVDPGEEETTGAMEVT